MADAPIPGATPQRWQCDSCETLYERWPGQEWSGHCWRPTGLKDADGLSIVCGGTLVPVASAEPPTPTEYQRGRDDVAREMSAALKRFNDDDSQGIGQLIEVFAPFLEPSAPSTPPRADRPEPWVCRACHIVFWFYPNEKRPTTCDCLGILEPLAAQDSPASRALYQLRDWLEGESCTELCFHTKCNTNKKALRHLTALLAEAER